MDDSFTDFKKKKKIKTGPKVDPKGKRNNQKKPVKRSKDQKDIRSLLKKNELVSYTQDFGEVCKQGGVDVDAEQLQLAIALSKSINEFQSSSEDVLIQNKQLSSQERSAKIRTTLQEYGFKVNNSKILLTLSKNKRKKYNKHSILLKISSEERQQKISYKYSQVLANNLCKSTDEEPKCIYLKHTIFYKATNIPYNNIKNDDAYYVSKLIDKPTLKTCLLRDWSEIPGRPVSPKPMLKDINFETLQYSQDELDNILSGSVDTAQNIVNSKQYVKEDNSLIDDLQTANDYGSLKNDTIELISSPSCSNNLKYNENQVSQMSDTEEIPDQVDDIQVSEKCSSIKDKENIECIDLIKDTSFKECSRTLKIIDSQSLNSRQFRSASPDLFDDEVCSIIEDKNSCSIIETNELCSIIGDKNSCSIIETNEVCSIVEDKNSCSIIETNELCSIIGDKNSCSIIETNEVCSIIEDKNSCSIIETNEVCSIIEDKNSCSIIETNEVCSIIEDKNSCSIIEINEECSIIKDKNYNSTRDVSKNDECGTIFMDLTECANNTYSKLNIRNTDTSKRKSNDVMDITECVKPNNNFDVILSSGETNEDKEENVEQVDLTQVLNSGQCSSETNKSTKESDSLDTDDTVIYDNIVFRNNVNESLDLQEAIDICDQDIAKDIINDKKSSEFDNLNNSNNNSCKAVEDDIISQKFDENVECENRYDDINIDLTQGSVQSEDSLNFPEYIYNDYRTETFVNNSGINKDSDIISLKSVSFDNIENQDDIDLTQNSDKCFEIAQENYALNCPGTSYNNSDMENFDYNVGTIDNKNNSIISVGSLVNKPFDKNNEDKIDLTQGTEEINEKFETGYYVHKNNSKLGKINNISIDYDEMFDEITSESRNVSKPFKNNSENDVNGSNPSINSEVFEISDKELNYSIHHSIHENININLDLTGRYSLNRSLSDGNVPTDNLYKPLSPIKEKNNSHPNTQKKNNKHTEDAIIQTPKNNEYIIKTREVTPMADYESMTSPERNEELDKYGLKPFKRKRAIQLLTYVYNQTHPVIQNCSPEEGPSKRLKKDNKYTSPKKKSKSPKKCLDFGSDGNKENDIFLVTKETPDIKNVECDPKEWVFQNREKAKVHSCRVPLHIAFHNYVSCRNLLREAILRYEPVNIDIIHRDLVSYGHKYNPKDLLKFMDRRCITVTTVENNLKNKKV